MKLLAELGLIQQDGEGKWQQADQAVTTGPEVHSLAVANFHKEMLRLTAESIDRHPSAERDITGLTLGVSGSRIQRIKELIAALRKELLMMACRDESADQVIQVNFQVFPLSKQVR
ncbi:MAG: DUF4423 domain-containing protein [Thermodesulfobacteriota bacterium]